MAFTVSGGGDDDAVRVTVTLDSVVFEDGQLAGPDVAGIAERVHGRHAAEQEILARISAAESAGENVQQMLESIANSEPNAPHDPRIISFAMRLRSRAGAGSFPRSRQPPQFWR